jgi:hypothetical protein
MTSCWQLVKSVKPPLSVNRVVSGPPLQVIRSVPQLIREGEADEQLSQKEQDAIVKTMFQDPDSVRGMSRHLYGARLNVFSFPCFRYT